ncbi:hypothetical protein THRCLA_23436, partial [Thraustotheca clavata]
FYTPNYEKTKPNPASIPSIPIVKKELTEEETLEALKEALLSPSNNQEVDSTDEKKPPPSDWTQEDLAQQALWALDVLSITQFNRITMKREKFHFVLREVICGSKLVVPRRLRIIVWNLVGNNEIE